MKLVYPRLTIGVLAASILTLGAVAQADSHTYSRSYKHSLVLHSGETLRLANLAGAIEILPATGGELVVEATIHGDAGSAEETKRLVDNLAWVQAHDKKGHAEWALSYPVDRYSGFAYTTRGNGGAWCDSSRTTMDYLGHRVSVYSRQRSDAPILYADLRIELPSGSAFAMRNGAGSIKASRLQGDLSVDTGSGDVDIAGLEGKLAVDTGSGDVSLGEVKADCKVDTGSGNVRIKSLIGNGIVDTGSGDVDVKYVMAHSFTAQTGSGNVRLGGGEVGALAVDTGSGNIGLEGVELETFKGDTGSGDVTIKSSLAKARDVVVDTGSGSVRILAGADASFDLEADQGSGDLDIGYHDAVFKHHGREIYGARRRDGKTRIRIETGSGDCVMRPQT
jgi:hypothetical protein